MITEGDTARGRTPDVAARAPQRWLAPTREAEPEWCLHAHRPWFLTGWEPGRGRFYACQVPGCDSVQYRY